MFLKLETLGESNEKILSVFLLFFQKKHLNKALCIWKEKIRSVGSVVLLN